MSFQPVVPMGGFAGWRFLNRTMETQRAAFDQSAALSRDAAYFRENIGKVTTAEALVADRRLLGVALAAFGLQDDIDNRFFIRKVMSDGTLDEGALANRLSDKRYRKLSAAFGFGDFETPNTRLSDFPDRIVAAYKTCRFEAALGQTNPDMRLAMNLTRELADLATTDSSDDTKWFTVMGSEPLRQVFQTALGLPDSFATLDIEKQLDTFRSRAKSTFGDGAIDQFVDPEKMDKLVRLFLVRSELPGGATGVTATGTALALLQSAAG